MNAKMQIQINKDLGPKLFKESESLVLLITKARAIYGEKPEIRPLTKAVRGSLGKKPSSPM